MVKNIDWTEFKLFRATNIKDQDNFMTLIDFLKSYYNMFSVLDIYETLKNDETAKMMLDKSKAYYYPTVDLEASINFNSNLGANEGKDDSYKGMIYLKYNIFNGFSDQINKEKYLLKINQEILKKEKLKRDIIEKINLAWAANKKLQQQLKYLKAYTASSLKTLKLYAKEYDLGRRSLLDLLTSQNEYINSKAQIIIVKYSILESKFRILDATGTLVENVLGNKRDILLNVHLTSKIIKEKK